MTVSAKDKFTLPESAHFKKFFEDEYAVVSFVESVPCIKLKVSGVPHSSEHFQAVQHKVLEAVELEMDNYCRLHLLTDNLHAGIVLNEDLAFYRDNILPQLEKVGIRYHAIVLPESTLVRFFLTGFSLSTKKINVAFFNTVSGATKWLRHR